MSLLKPFRAVRPLPEYAYHVAALPYDVMNSKEAAQMVKNKPYSFLHVDRAEIDMPDISDAYSPAVYQKARANLHALVANGVCSKDDKPMFYIYRLIMNGRSQTGVVGCVSVDEYIDNTIKKHEYTVAEKEKDRINHVDVCDANTGPIYLTHRPDPRLSALLKNVTESKKPVYDFFSDNGVENIVWLADSDETIAEIIDIFKGIDSLYIADGHHRAASAAHVGVDRRRSCPDYDGSEEFNYFLAVLFACDELKILPYNRVVKDTAGLSKEEFLKRVSVNFDIEEIGKDAFEPKELHTFGMLLGDTRYRLKAKEGTFSENDAVESLDVSIIHNNLLAPVLGIVDPRADKRIEFIGGIRGVGELERRVKEDMALAFSMYPTSVDQLMKIADNGKIMPPKSTWFEPKLLSGLFIHELK